jgi:predicted N-acetyltransferase YhbS
MGIVNRRYKLLGDFGRVFKFLENQYDDLSLNGYLLSEFFEYAHTHPNFNRDLTHRFGIWEKDDEIIGIACYENQLGECLISVSREHQSIMAEILEYAEKELSAVRDGKSVLEVWTTDVEEEKINLLIAKGYEKTYSEPAAIFTYDQDFPEVELPEGYTIISLEDENNFKKINECLWKGFDHGDEPDDDLDCRMLMQSGPHFSKALTTVIKAPNGDYACFAGMWFNEMNKYAYLEPLATPPEYRRKGLATIALVEGMKKTKALGAKYCFGGSSKFYYSIGFKSVCNRDLWRKEWKD